MSAYYVTHLSFNWCAHMKEMLFWIWIFLHYLISTWEDHHHCHLFTHWHKLVANSHQNGVIFKVFRPAEVVEWLRTMVQHRGLKLCLQVWTLLMEVNLGRLLLWGLKCSLSNFTHLPRGSKDCCLTVQDISNTAQKIFIQQFLIHIQIYPVTV